MYNATAIKINSDGNVCSVEAVELDDAGRVVRACGLWSPLNGRAEFEQAWRSAQFSFVAEIRIVRDGARAYRERLGKLSLPASYTE